MLTKAVRGGDILVFVNNKPFAVATGVRWETEVGRHSLYGIDQAKPFELASGQTAIKGSMEVVRVRTQAGLEATGVSIPEELILRERYFHLVVVDRLTDNILVDIAETASSGERWQASARGELTGSFSFEGIGWAHELSR